MKHSQSFSSQRGSVLLTALLFCAAIAIMLGGYISVALQTTKLSNRSYHMSAAMNAAETGLEEAIWAINQLKTGVNPAVFDSWTSVGAADKKLRFTDLTFGQNTDGYAEVYVKNYNGTSGAPKITSEAVLTLPDGALIRKKVEVTLRLRSYFSGAMVAKGKIEFGGNNASVDSWNSDPDKDSTTAAIAYSSSVRNDNGSVGSVAVVVNAITVNNADVWGYVATGADDPTNSVKKNGSVLGEDSDSKDKSSWERSNVDPDRVSTDFTYTFEPVTAPSIGIGIGPITSNISLPRTGDSAAADGKYYYVASGIALSGNNDYLNIASNKQVVLIVPTGYDVNITGNNGSINIPNGAKLELFAGGNVDVKGNGIVNGTPPSGSDYHSNSNPNTVQQATNFKLWGTSTTSQNIDIGGKGALSGAVYAPNAIVKIHGGGTVLGSIVANEITLVGGGAFHYDEALMQDDNANPYGIAQWRELFD